MSLKKDFKFDPSLAELANFHFAFSHPARLQIIARLRANSKLGLAELARDIPLHHATVSQHIAILRRTQLIQPVERRDGSTGYQLDTEAYSYFQSQYHLFSKQT